MPFKKEPTRAPSRISRVTLHLAVLKAEDGTLTYEDTFDIGVVLSNGEQVTRSGVLREHLSPSEVQTVKSFLDAKLLQAETEIL